MNKLFIANILLALGCLVSACASQPGADEVLNPIKKNVQPPSNNDEPNPPEIPPNIPSLEKIIFFPKDHSWKDLDEFYREEMPKHEGLPYYENLQNIFFYHLSTQFSLCEEANQERIAFYLEEQAKLNYVVNFREYSKCLLALQGYWTNAKIKSMAHEVFTKGLKVINKLPSDKQSKLFMKEYEMSYYDQIRLLPN